MDAHQLAHLQRSATAAAALSGAALLACWWSGHAIGMAVATGTTVALLFPVLYCRLLVAPAPAKPSPAASAAAPRAAEGEEEEEEEHKQQPQAPEPEPDDATQFQARAWDAPDAYPPPPAFPTLRTGGGGPEGARLQLNSRTPVPFEDDLFAGHLLFALKTDPVDPFYEPLFRGRRRVFEIHIQGRFKQQPGDTIFMGAAIERRMQLGIITRGLTSAILRVVKTLVPSLHASFGDAREEEAPHIVFPMWQVVDRMVETPRGCEPPPLGVELPESDASRQARRRTVGQPPVHLDSVYSFSFHSMYVHFPSWTAQLPMLSPMDLHTFWGDQALTLMSYVLARPDAAGAGRHLRANQRFFFRFRIAHSDDGHEADRLTDDDAPAAEADLPAAAAAVPAADEVAAAEDDDDVPALAVPAIVEVDRAAHALIEVSGEWSVLVARPEQHLGSPAAPASPDEDAALSSTETRRRALDRHVRGLSAQDPAVAVRLRSFKLRYGRHRRRSPLQGRAGPPTADRVAVEGAVLRALNARYWRVEWARVARGHLLFFHANKRKPSLSLPLTAVVSARLLVEDAAAPFAGPFHFVEVATVGRVHVVAVESAAAAAQWVGALSAGAGATGGGSYGDDPRATFLNPHEFWRPRSRLVLNSRRLVFGEPQRMGGPDAVRLSARLLSRALRLRPDDADDSLVAFLDDAVHLQRVDLPPLSHDERLAFFVNVYHLLVAHAFLLLGPPNSALRVGGYHSSVSYAVGGCVFSLAEIEHCVLRAHMTKPRSLFQFAVPRAPSPHALRAREHRLSFVLNCGSLSCADAVPVLSLARLDEQLNAAAAAFLDMHVRVNPAKRQVTLPKVCEWYRDDFADGSSVGCLSAVLPHLPRGKARQVAALLQEPRAPVIKFSSYDWGSRGSLRALE